MAKKIITKVSGKGITELKPKARVITKNVLKKSAFIFKIKPNPVIFKTKVKLSGPDAIDVQVIRNPGLYTKIVPDASFSKINKDSNWNCSEKRWSGDVIRKEPVILNKNMDELYPGAIFAYESISNGTYKRLPYPRKPLTVVVNRNQASLTTLTVDNPSVGSIMQAMSNIRGSFKGGGAAISFGESFAVLSEEDLFMRTGGSGYYLGFGGSHSVDYKSSSKSHKFFINLFQEYYSILIDDTHMQPSDFFVTTDESPTTKDALKPELIDPNWVVVSSVKYGRVLNLMFESDESYSEYGMDVTAYANFLVAGGSANFSLRQKDFLKRVSVRFVAYGGNPSLTGQILTAGNQSELTKAIKNYFAGTMDEVPIGYSLATLDGENVGARLMSDFTSRQCAPAAGKYEVLWNSVTCDFNDDGSDGEEITAYVRIRAWDGNGKEIPDIENKNKNIIAREELNKKSGLKLPVPWTFTRGTKSNPIQLNTGETREINQRITFKVSKDDKNAKLGIRTDVLEYDDFNDDHFTDDVRNLRFSEIIDGQELRMICTHERSRIRFNITVRPVYD
jgi:hypothetical protein